jgi:hypothetical protein
MTDSLSPSSGINYWYHYAQYKFTFYKYGVKTKQKKSS